MKKHFGGGKEFRGERLMHFGKRPERIVRSVVQTKRNKKMRVSLAPVAVQQIEDHPAHWRED